MYIGKTKLTEMKHLMTALVCLFAINMSAQTGFVEFPYNPDSDNDDIIGIEDLMGLLSLYGSEFSEEGLYLSTDSTDALYHTGSMYYPQCYKSCNDLPGNWHIPTRDEMYKHDLASLTGTGCFIQADVKGHALILDENRHRVMWVGNGSSSPDNGRVLSEMFNIERQCYCATHERPNVEYSYCESSNIQACADLKAADGWYPLGGLSLTKGDVSGFTQTGLAQAFWRWAE